MFNQTFKTLKNKLKQVFGLQSKPLMVSSKVETTKEEKEQKITDSKVYRYNKKQRDPWWVTVYRLKERPKDTSMYIMKSFGTASRIGKF